MKKDAPKETVFSKRLREARSRAKVTQAELGVKAGIDEASASARINQYERATHAPTYNTARRLAFVLQVPVSFLFEEDDEIAAFLLKFAALSNEERSKTRDFVESIVATGWTA